MGHDALQDRLEKNVVGMAEMRTRQAEVMDMVANHYETVFLRDNKRNACSRSALLLHPDLCDIMLSRWKFQPQIEEDESSCRITIRELGAKGEGSSRPEALEALLEDILNQVRAFFSEMDLHARLPETRERFPWFLKVLKCRSLDDIIRTVGLEQEQ